MKNFSVVPTFLLDDSSVSDNRYDQISPEYTHFLKEDKRIDLLYPCLSVGDTRGVVSSNHVSSISIRQPLSILICTGSAFLVGKRVLRGS